MFEMEKRLGSNLIWHGLAALIFAAGAFLLVAGLAALIAAAAGSEVGLVYSFIGALLSCAGIALWRRTRKAGVRPLRGQTPDASR